MLNKFRYNLNIQCFADDENDSVEDTINNETNNYKTLLDLVNKQNIEISELRKQVIEVVAINKALLQTMDNTTRIVDTNDEATPTFDELIKAKIR